ncbi:MAG: LVIVD repeat-containing protein [Gemmatimonadaceae bacterium]
MRKSFLVLTALGLATAARAQDPGSSVRPFDQKHGGSSNVHVIAHVVTHPGLWKASDIEMEQDPGRPYVYVSGFTNFDAQAYDVRDPAHPKKVFDWTIENPELHRGIGAMDGKYFKIGNRYYFAQSYQFMQGSPDADLGAVIFDVTGLPDSSKVKVVARIRYPQAPGGFHNTYAYKHSDGRVLYFATVNQPKALVYDLGKVVSGADSSSWLIGNVPNPTPFRQTGAGGYHDFYVGYDAATHQDKFYGAGLGGYSTWDVTTPASPKELFTITGLGLDIAHTFTPSPDGKYAVTETEYEYTPLRIWDLTLGQNGTRKNLDIPISGWAGDWRDLAHNHEVRWPYVFVSAYEDGLQVFDLKDPTNPKTDGYYFTCACQHMHGFGGTPDNGWESVTSVEQGAFGVDVRNSDGLIALSDMRSGLWLFKMDGFTGWNGHDYGMPNISSVQDYDHGPAVQAAARSTPHGSVATVGKGNEKR